MPRFTFIAASFTFFVLIQATFAADGNRLTYLDEFCDPYYPHVNFPKLTTPQWVGEEEVDAVVVLAIDDMRDTKRYEAYLRPILARLQEIDGRAPVSIMTCKVDPQDPQLAKWIEEGLSIEVHTIDHPCPLLQGGDFDKAKSTYDRCVDLMNEIPGNKPVAFRMPCCDSRNTPSPRFWMEIFNKRTESGNFLRIDTSVFNVFTSADKELPRELVYDDVAREGEAPAEQDVRAKAPRERRPPRTERFRKYIPFPSFVNTIENYPYPYVIGRLCWQFPCMVPSDWEAQNLHRPNNPKTVADMKAALDATVLKQGVFSMVFHPHGWIRNDQIVELIDYAQETYGKRVMFLTFREAIDRLNENLLGGQPLRDEKGEDNGVRILDVDNDGWMDVAIGNKQIKQTRIWNRKSCTWDECSFPTSIQHAVDSYGFPFTRFGVTQTSGVASVLGNPRSLEEAVFWHFDSGTWRKDSRMSVSLDRFNLKLFLRDLDSDGICEAIEENSNSSGRVLQWNTARATWDELPFRFPKVIGITSTNSDNGVRLVDINGDGNDDLFFSNNRAYGLSLFDSMKTGWSIRAFRGDRRIKDGPPSLVRSAPHASEHETTSNGGWFHSGHLWIQNEDTNRLPDFVDRISYADMLNARAKREAILKLPPVPIGAAKIDITPDYPLRLSGYGSRKTESEGVAQNLWAKALAIGSDDGEGAAILITVENCGMTPAIRTKVAKVLDEKAKIRNERLAISVSHSHTAPCLTNWAPYIFGSDIPPDQQARIDRYTNELTGKLVQVAIDALKMRRPGRLYWGQTTLDFAANRRVIKDGRWTGFGVQADGPVDHSLPVLVAKDEEGKLISIVADYACHCTTLGGNFNRIAGDWAGFAQDMIEMDHPGAVALITIGCGADANPNPRGKLEQAEDHGEKLADAVKQLLKNDFLEPIDSRPRCRLTDIDLPLAKLPTREQWQERVKEGGATGYHARQMLKKLDAGEKLPTSIDYPIATWTFGKDLALVFLGGEVVVDYAIRMKEEFDADRLWITAYTNDVPCYIPSRRILREGGYEADRSMIYYARPTRFDPAVEDLIVNTVQKLLPAEFYSKKKQVDFPAPKSADEAIHSFKLSRGMKIELVAAEPLIVDPVAFDWGPDGRLWVVEMRDYPNGMGWQREGDPLGRPGGRIKVLTDEDGDGRYDKAQVFLDKIPFPTGVKVWRNGILVTAAPEIFYAEDTDGDGRVDKREVLYQGFGEGNQQHRVNGLRWGLDNWLHVGNGDSDGKIKSLKTGDVVDVRGRDLRIHPDEGRIEATSGRTQFGRSRDDWGNWFGGNNSNPMWHYVLDDRYLRRNPHFAPPSVRKDVPQQPGAAPVYPASRTLARFNDLKRANRFTSACSPMIYRDQLLFRTAPSARRDSPRALRFSRARRGSSARRRSPARRGSPDLADSNDRRSSGAKGNVQSGSVARSGDRPQRALPACRTGAPDKLEACRHSFVCEPVHNLVHREIVAPDGASFTSRRADDEQEREFLASTDNWFRPVMVRTGPDGTLWIADMYRFVIEHPKWIPEDWQRKLDLRAGGNRGRIYRVFPKNTQPRKIPRLDKLDTAALVTELESPNGTVRDMAQQLIIWRNEKAAVDKLRLMLREAKRATVRLHALCTLDGMGRFGSEDYFAAMKDAHPGVKRHAIRCSEQCIKELRSNDVPVFRALLLEIVRKNADPQLQLQVAYTLGELPETDETDESDNSVGSMLAELLMKPAQNPYVSAAATSSINAENISDVLSAALSSTKNRPDGHLVEQLLSMARSMGAEEAVKAALKEITRTHDGEFESWQLSALAGLLDTRDRNSQELDGVSRADIAEVVGFARRLVADQHASDDNRLAAIRLLGRRDVANDADAKSLANLLSPNSSAAIQAAAAVAVGRIGRNSAAEMLLENWPAHSPNLRRQILDILLGRATWTSELLHAVERKELRPSDIDASRRQRLLTHKSEIIRRRAEKIFAGATDVNRQRIIQRFQNALRLAGDETRGKSVFAKRCAACHKLDSIGHEVGPDLAAITDRSPHSLLVAIFDPNRAVEDKFLDYQIITTEGKQLTGLITQETGNSITLLAADGKQQTVLRNRIDQMRATGKSLMPEGLEKDLTEQNAADLIAYLRLSGTPPKRFPGNEPRLITADTSGQLTLPASAARIYGPRLVFEQKYRNLGWWAREQDYAAWSLVIPKSIRYQVILDYASHKDAAGDRFQLAVAGETLTGIVESTGTWDDYREKKIGTLDLPAGTAEVIFRSDGRVQSALIDLRTIRLVPLDN